MGFKTENIQARRKETARKTKKTEAYKVESQSEIKVIYDRSPPVGLNGSRYASDSAGMIKSPNERRIERGTIT